MKSKKSSAREYLLANGEMGVIPTALSLTVSFVSAISVLGMPSEIYMHGTMFLYQIIAWIIGLTLSALVFMPKFRELNYTSIFEVIYMAIVLYAPALALSQTTGLNIWLSVISIGVICTFYSSIGGIKAIIWTDVLQFTFILVGLLPATIQGLIQLGGLKQTFLIASRDGRIEFDNVNFDPRTRHTVWTLIIGCSFNILAEYSFNQALVQRYLCVRSVRAARQVILINGIGIIIFILLLSLTGLVIYAFYANCDPYTAGFVSSSDQLFPYFVMEVLSNTVGLRGIFLACIFSASLSTISSGLNSLAAVFIEDVYQGLMRRRLNDEQLGRVSKIYSAILGAVVILLSFAVSYLGSVLNAALSLGGVFAGPIMGVFFLGFFFPRVQRRSALVGLLSGLGLQLWIFLGAQMTKNRGQSGRLPLSVTNCSKFNTTTLPLASMTTISYANE
ncbi:unnamed protein product [Adineta steineri]|uniref:Sodium-coupled monocarboxylate transporter 2 n=1 Tax=Adineta steineri TaxID=433720 RepID=A0A819J0U7_9BILA|nr:unnamed protein product [Adineta steineri]CAF3925696.1 unnamed protein product [Adineta steineri]